MALASPAAQLNTMIARFDPAIQKVVRQARTRLRKRLPAAVELVYDNYNALAIGYGSSEKKGDLIVSLAVYARGVNLYFIYGVALADPHGLLLALATRGASSDSNRRPCSTGARLTISSKRRLPRLTRRSRHAARATR